MVVSNEAGSFFYKERHVWTVYRGERLSQILFERKGWLYTGYTYRDASKPSRREAREREKIRRKRGEGKRRKRLWECRSHPYIFSIFSWPYLLLWVPTTSLPLSSLTPSPQPPSSHAAPMAQRVRRPCQTTHAFLSLETIAWRAKSMG